MVFVGPDEAWCSQDTHLNNHPILGPSCQYFAKGPKHFLTGVVSGFPFSSSLVMQDTEHRITLEKNI